VNLHGEPGEPRSCDIEEMDEIISHVDLLIKSRELDEKLERTKLKSGSTIIGISGNRIEIKREGEMEIADISSIAERWGFALE